MSYTVEMHHYRIHRRTNDNFSGTLARTHSTEQCTNYLDCAISSTAPSSSAVPSSVPTFVPTTNIIEKPELTEKDDDGN
jgi:hypothetical protein